MMGRTASMPGYQLRAGDVIHMWGLKWRVKDAPTPVLLDSGKVQWFINVVSVNPGGVPAGYDHGTFSSVGEWLVEF